jgi:4-hydroxy-tetrahydrodipicolinate synthase
VTGAEPILRDGGVYAAALSPRTEAGELDLDALSNLIRFLRSKGVDGIVVNGATGEYPYNRLEESKAVFLTCAHVLDGQLPFVCGIGASTVKDTVLLGLLARDLGSAGVLLPNPYFFPFGQEDVMAFCLHVVQEVDAHVLLYNLPQFTTGFDTASVEELARTGKKVVGLKDSSGTLEIFRSLNGRAGASFQRIVGSDQVLVPALDECLCDAVISGVSCVLPELICFLMRSHSAVRSPWYARAEEYLSEFIEQISRFPTPWGLKWAAEYRGICNSGFPLPLSARRETQARAFREWFGRWWPGVESLLEAAQPEIPHNQKN